MPLVSQTFDQLLDFTRTTAATFVGSNGLIQNTPASRNLLTWTQQFDNAAWENQLGGTGVACVTTANAGTAPDDTSTADRLQFSLAGGTSATDITRRRQGVNTPATTHTYSVYLRSTDGTSTYNMHLTDANGATRLIIVTGSWQRFSVSAVGVAGTVFYSIGLRGGQSPANSNTADVLAWGAQLEQAATATTYTRNNGGVYPPRFDYDPVTLAPKGLLIEEQRTNLLLRSEEFDNASWGKSNATVTANATASPDGTTDAEKLVEDTAAGVGHYILQSPSATAATVYTTTVYAKAAERNWVHIYEDSGANIYGFFNVSTGALGTLNNCTASITNVGNGWYRCSLTYTQSGTTARIRYGVTTGNAVFTYTGDGTSGLFLWGAQLEAGAFATSYIPTVASQVTRAPDQTSIVAPNFAPWYNQSEGTIVSTFSSFATSGGSRIVTELSDGTVNNRYTQAHTPTGSDRFLTFSGGSAVVTTLDYAAVGVNAVGKWAGAYAAGNYGASLNGAAALSATYGSVLAGINLLTIGSSVGGAALNGHIRSIRYYPVRLSDAQLQALTA
jgi:hypothetical protein